MKATSIDAPKLRSFDLLTADTRVSKRWSPVELSWDEKVIPLTMDEAWQKLRQGDPPIIIVDKVFMTRCLEEGELLLVAKRLREFFTAEAGRA